MDVADFGFGLFSEVQPLIVANGADTEIRFNGNIDLVRLIGVNAGDLSAEDFVFSG